VIRHSNVNGRRSSASGVAAATRIPARNRARNRRPRVLFVTDFYVEDVLLGIVDHAREAGWELNANMRFHGRFPVTEADGILATVTGERVRDWLVEREGCPVVRMMSTSFDLPYPSVQVDYVAAGQAGAQHLMELGHVHFAFYWLFDVPDVLEVRNAFEAELAAAGRRSYRLDFPAAHPGMAAAQIPRADRERWLASQLKRLPKPLAIMADDDRRALELLCACERARLRVPEDVAIIGCDNNPVHLAMASIPLSSMDVNFKSLGKEAARLLDQLMRREVPNVRVIRPAIRGVMARQSTATFVTNSAGITAAVRYLREHFHERPRLAELAQRAGLSVRVFESEFKRHVGHSAREELQRARIACAARLLRDTKLKVDAIAVESGFGSASKLCGAFAKTYGFSPNAWRHRVKEGA
jgi:LacI family transcriptional regulator